MSGRQAFTQQIIRDQLSVVEEMLDSPGYFDLDRYWYKYRRYYLLRRLLTLQLKEFNHD